MSVFLLGGKAKGFEILLPAKVNFRPTSVMIRRKFFDFKQNWSEQIFIDLCAGSGAMGFEALSRGAEKIYLNDSSVKQVKVMHEQKLIWCEKFPEDEQKIIISKSHALNFLKELNIKNNMWIFFDPPYDDADLYADFLAFVREKELILKSTIVLEYESRVKMPPVWMPELEKFRSQGKYRELESSDRKLLIIQGK